MLSAAVVALLLFSGPAYCADEDKAPAYMIYIDPETGKYTTENPDAKTKSDAVVVTAPTTDARQPNLSVLIIGASVFIAMLVAGVIKYQRRQLI